MKLTLSTLPLSPAQAQVPSCLPVGARATRSLPSRIVNGLLFASLLLLLTLPVTTLHAQDPNTQPKATVESGINEDGSGRIVVEAHGIIPEAPVFFSADATTSILIGAQETTYEADLKVRILQGEAEKLSLELLGPGEVTGVKSGEIEVEWAVRRDAEKRFLDLTPPEKEKNPAFVVTMKSPEYETPATLNLLHLGQGDAAGFSNRLTVNHREGLAIRLLSAGNFLIQDLESEDSIALHTSTGGEVSIGVSHAGTAPQPVELRDVMVRGVVDPDNRFVTFDLTGQAIVREKDARVEALSGNLAVSNLPLSSPFRVELAPQGDALPRYDLFFEEPGSYPVRLEFVVEVTRDGEWHRLEFNVLSSAVTPMELTGLGEQAEFREGLTVIPVREEEAWQGYVPASGSSVLAWKPAREATEGKLFFTTTGMVQAQVGAGLLRQFHEIEYRILQGELDFLSLRLDGPAEVLRVGGSDILGWQVREQEDHRLLDIQLSQPIQTSRNLSVTTQTALSNFPVQVEASRLTPVGAVRHAGYIRLTNQGAVRVEPENLTGLTQLSPDQFPGAPVEARQVYVYRFPSADFSWQILADRIQPEVNVSQLTIYEFTETDRIIRSDVELDIREAPVREWDMRVPADYSVVSVTGAGVADYVVGSEVTTGTRGLKVIFNQDVAGRQLISLHLEKNAVPEAGEWILPPIEFPEAKTVRGDIGVAGVAGFRIAVATTDLLAEKPLATFPKALPNLQQAFRIRERGWSGTMLVQQLPESLQADVFHLYSLSERTAYGSVLVNYFVTGAPVSEFRLMVPEDVENLLVDGRDVRNWRQEGDILIVSLHQPVIGPWTLLVTHERKLSGEASTFQPGRVTPLDVRGERGYIHLVSPVQVNVQVAAVSEELLKLDPLELPAEFQLLTSAPPLGTWQYTERPFELAIDVQWYEPGETITQIVEFAEVQTRVSPDGALVTDLQYYVKSRGSQALRLELPADVRLWNVTVSGRSVTARQDAGITLIPLPSGSDPNLPIPIMVRLGKAAQSTNNPVLALPKVGAPVLKTEWIVQSGSEDGIYVPSGGNFSPVEQVNPPHGYRWLAQTGLGPFLVLTLLAGLGLFLSRFRGWFKAPALILLAGATLGFIALAFVAADDYQGHVDPLKFSIPALLEGEEVVVQIHRVNAVLAHLTLMGGILMLAGIVTAAWGFWREREKRRLFLTAGAFLFAMGILYHRNSATVFLTLVALVLLGWAIPSVGSGWKDLRDGWRRSRAERRRRKQGPSGGSVPGGTATATLLTLAALGFGLSGQRADAQEAPPGFGVAESIIQSWTIQDGVLHGKGTAHFTGRPGDSFILLKSPAVLTRFEGAGLLVRKSNFVDTGLVYVVTVEDPTPPSVEPAVANSRPLIHEAQFEFQMTVSDPVSSFTVPVGVAIVQKLEIQYDRPGWVFESDAAVRTENDREATEVSRARMLLAPRQNASIELKPLARDPSSEDTRFFVEGENLYLPSPGVVDGRHRFQIRPAQGQVRGLTIHVPDALTVSEVQGEPVSDWQFDAEKRTLTLNVEPAQSGEFEVLVATQMTLDPLPAETILAPLQVSGAEGEVGLIALAFGPDAQPESMTSEALSQVNINDFRVDLLPSDQFTIHRVYRYSQDGGQIALRVAPVAPEVRVNSRQVLSLGDERLVLAIDFTVDITRTGLFQLSFPLPAGMEIDSLSGGALSHWAESTTDAGTIITMHLNGKTLGTQQFALTLSAPAPDAAEQWTVPHFLIREATRQTGDLVVQPATGIRVRTVARQNASEVDPRSMGANATGALAFRLLQQDWSLIMAIEKLDPWVTAQVLQEVTLREGQTRTVIYANFNVENASIRGVRVQLPISGEDEIRSLRAIGPSVSDLVRVAEDQNLWDIQFKRRVVGNVQLRLEYERRGGRGENTEAVDIARFPELGQISYYVAVRSGGRLQMEAAELPRGWQRADWNTVPQSLREAGNRTIPLLTLRAVAPEEPLTLLLQRHALAEALRLRVSSGNLMSVISPLGDQLTAVDLNVEVIQRSSLTVGLPAGGELFSIFVNGESITSVRQGDQWQFYILPGPDDRNANVRFVYSVPGERIRKVRLLSPMLNVPLENISWRVLAPAGYHLVNSEGDLELRERDHWASFDKTSYLNKTRLLREGQAEQAAELLQQANQLLQEGEQTKARVALNSVANSYALDAASNEDARVQLQNLQTQQAVVGLSTRRQRVSIENTGDILASPQSQQLEAGAASNPVLQEGRLEFRPQELTQLLQGNTTDENAVLQRIASRLVSHQRAAEPAPQAISLTLPEEGNIYTFHGTVQVEENAPLELTLWLAAADRVHLLRFTALVLLLLLLSLAIFRPWRRSS